MASTLKTSINDLAIFGGPTIFNKYLHVGRPNVGNRHYFNELVEDILSRRWLTNKGRYVQDFERRLEEFLGVKHCVVMCNATVALEIAIRALGLEGEVIIPSFTFIATAHSLQWQEITPIFCDIDPATHNINPARIEELITPRTTGIIGVHVWGRPCEAHNLEQIARRNGLRLMYDAAHAFGCSLNGKQIGSLGDAEVFSFHATKFFNTFEGGAIATNDDQLAAKIRLMKNFGFAGEDEVIYIGTNGKMSEVSAAMGLAGLDIIDAFVETNRQNYRQYRKCLKQLPGIKVIAFDELEINNYQYIVLELDGEVIGINRDLILSILKAENILARRYFYPGCHRMEPYKSYYPMAGLWLSETERLVQNVMQLPTGTAVGRSEIEQICQLIRFTLDHGPEISSKFDGEPGETI